MITPIEIRQHTFKKAFQGFSKEDVQAYLSTLASEWERMLEDNKRLKTELDKTTNALDNLRQVESALHRTLLQAEETSKATIESAKNTAEQRIQEADAKAKEMLSSALEDRKRVELQTSELVARRNEILQQLKGYLTAQTERLKTFEEKEMKTPLIMTQAPVAPAKEAPAAEETAAPVQQPAQEAKPVVAAAEARNGSAPVENDNVPEAETQSFFEKSVVSAPVSTVINDIADEL